MQPTWCSARRASNHQWLRVSVARCPALGGALAVQSSLWGARWLQVAIVIYLVAETVLLLVIVPSQRRIMGRREGRLSDGPPIAADIPGDIKALRASIGIFSMLLVVLILMVTKPW